MPKTMKAGLAAAMLAAGLLSAAGPAFAAASQEARRECERKAVEVRPILNAPEREAFIANCLADATATPTPAPKKKSGGGNY